MNKNSIKIEKFLYHATKNPIGSSSKDLHAPSLDRPFFVTDNWRMASKYVQTFDYNSVYVFKCDPRKLVHNSWWVKDRNCLKELARRLPDTAMYLYRKIESGRWDTLYSCVYTMQTYMRDLLNGVVKPGKDPLLELALKELRAGSFNDDGVFEVEKGFEGLADLDPDKFTKCRRELKARMFKEISGLGYKALMDLDTSGEWGVLDKFEFGLFDLDLLSEAWSESVEPNQDAVDEVQEKMLGGSNG